MNPTFTSITLLALALLGAPVARAQDGHDHGHDHAAQAAPAAAVLPRFSAVSETFELVGVLDGRQLAVYLDRADDNSPVSGARVELELAGHKLTLRPTGVGAFEAELPTALQPGEFAVAATVTAGARTDLLAGDLDVHGAAGADPHDPHGASDAHAAAGASTSTGLTRLGESPAVLATATGAGGLLLGLLLARLARRRRSPDAGADVTRGVSA
jgi:hypothetical protein